MYSLLLLASVGSSTLSLKIKKIITKQEPRNMVKIKKINWYYRERGKQLWRKLQKEGNLQEWKGEVAGCTTLLLKWLEPGGFCSFHTEAFGGFASSEERICVGWRSNALHSYEAEAGSRQSFIPTIKAVDTSLCSICRFKFLINCTHFCDTFFCHILLF